jgi:folate-dependent phosphoribosylglycinamide formyltransferase PurN
MNLGVLASHEGTTLQSLLVAFAGGRIAGVFRWWSATMATLARCSRLAKPAFRQFICPREAESGVSIHLVDPEYDTALRYYRERFVAADNSHRAER